MHTDDLLFHRLTYSLFSEDYIAWATALLGERSDVSSLWELASLALYSIIDPYEVEQHFQRCASDLGLNLVDKEQASTRYTRYICTSMLSGAMDLEDGLDRLCRRFDDEERYLYGIWEQRRIDLRRRDGAAGGHDAPPIDAEEASMPHQDFTLLLAAQFLLLIERALPNTFPYVLLCASCGTVPVEIDFPASGAHCPGCRCAVSQAATGPCLDMRKFAHREHFLHAGQEWPHPQALAHSGASTASV